MSAQQKEVAHAFKFGAKLSKLLGSAKALEKIYSKVSEWPHQHVMSHVKAEAVTEIWMDLDCLIQKVEIGTLTLQEAEKEYGKQLEALVTYYSTATDYLFSVVSSRFIYYKNIDDCN